MAFNEFFTEMALPFLLVFVVVFAILQKSKILGDGKAQIDALTSLAIALMLIGVPFAREMIINLMPWMAVGIAVILVFLILYGFVAGDLTNAPDWMKVTFGILAGLFTLGVVIYVTGIGKVLSNYFSGVQGDGFLMNAVLIVLVIAAMVIAVLGSKKNSD